MQTKICTTCGRELPLDNFYKNKSKKYGVQGECKECFNIRRREYHEKNKEKEKLYRENNRERISLRDKEYYENNREKIILHRKEYYKNNKEKISLIQKEHRETNREKYRLYGKSYYEKNREAKIKKSYEYIRKRRKDDELFAFTDRVRGLIRRSVARKGYTKKSKTQEIVGCTFEQLKEHLENTWYNNYGTPYNGEPVHIDHIIPLSTAKSEEDVIKLCHYTNLQYLKPEDNLKKSDKLDYVLE